MNRRNALKFFAGAAAFASTAWWLAWSASAQSAISSDRQVKLSEEQIQRFISAHKDMRAVTDIHGSDPAKFDQTVRIELDSRAAKHGFANFVEYDEVAGTITLIMSSIDPKTKVFTEPQAAIQKEIDQVEADRSIPDKDKAQLLEELKEARKSAQPNEFSSNIDLVMQYHGMIESTLSSAR